MLYLFILELMKDNAKDAKKQVLQVLMDESATRKVNLPSSNLNDTALKETDTNHSLTAPVYKKTVVGKLDSIYTLSYGLMWYAYKDKDNMKLQQSTIDNDFHQNNDERKKMSTNVDIKANSNVGI